jgi:Family of unknown function (DUF6479)
MRSLSLELAARGHLVGIGPLVIGILLVLALIVARIRYVRRKAQEPPPPAEPQPRSGAWETPEEHGGGGVPPNHGPGHQDGPEPVGYENVRRDPEEVRPLNPEEAEESQTKPRRGGRRTPHQVRPYQGPRT